MKKFYFIVAALTLLTAWSVYRFPASAQVESDTPVFNDRAAASTTLVLSQVSGGNGFYSNDWVEIKNVSPVPQSLNGLSLLYGSATGNFGGGVFALANVSVAPGQYYLVQLNSAAPGTTPLPVAPDASTTSISMSGSSGKIGIVNAGGIPGSACGATATPCTSAQLAAFVDWVAYGAAGNGTAGNGEGGTSVNNGIAFTNTQGAVRKTGGCTDTDNNNADFDVATNPIPRNTGSPLAPCGGGSGLLQGFGNASPNSVAPGGVTLLTVTVSPAASPPSTGITVKTDLTSIGGSATQSFFDDGTNGDTTAGDNVFSFLEAVPAGVSSGSHPLAVSIADAELRTAAATISLTITGPPDPNDNLALGNPSGATTDVSNPTNYLLVKTQYVMSYHRDRGTPNWVAWHLDSSWIGTADRQNDFRPDPSLPAGWYQVQDTDYSSSGFDRGHHCPSGDRTDTVADNSATFFMTNMMPQAPYNNQGVWADLENYCRSLVQSGNELYIYAGGVGTGGTGSNGGVTNTLANGHVTVPAQTWKVIVILPVGSNDAQRVNSFTRTIAVLMPNSQSVGAPGTGNWRNYRTTVGKIEQITGFNFFTAVRPQVRIRLKKHVDSL